MLAGAGLCDRHLDILVAVSPRVIQAARAALANPLDVLPPIGWAESGPKTVVGTPRHIAPRCRSPDAARPIRLRRRDELRSVGNKGRREALSVECSEGLEFNRGIEPTEPRTQPPDQPLVALGAVPVGYSGGRPTLTGWAAAHSVHKPYDS